MIGRPVEQARRTIVDLMTGMFATLFPSPSWAPYVLCAATIFGLTYGLTPEDQAFIQRCLGREQLPTGRARRVVLIIGRRGGKSRFAGFLAVFLACFCDYSNVLSVGERGTGMVIAPDRRQTRTIMRYIAAFIDHVPMLAAMVERRTTDAIHFRNGITIEVHTASFRSVRGYSIVFVIIDEAAFLPTDESAEPDAELVAALLPGLATTGGMLVLISSPHAKRGEIYRAHRDHFGKDDDEWLVWKAPTRTMNPTIPEALVTRAFAEDPARAASAWNADFRSDIEGYVTTEALDLAIARRLNLPALSTERYQAFVDPAGSGRVNADSFTAAVGHRDKDNRVIVDALFEKRPPFSPEVTVAELAEWLRPYRVKQVTGDRYAGEWPREQFRKHGIAYALAEKPKSDLYRDFLPLVNSGRVELPDWPRLRTQLAGLERRVARGGRESIDHGPAAHDDLANVVAGVAVQLAARTRAPHDLGITVAFLLSVALGWLASV